MAKKDDKEDAMMAFLGTPTTAAKPAPAPATPAKAEQSEPEKPAGKKKPGRPPKAPQDIAKQTAIRLDPEDLKAVKKLAVDDGMTFNRVVYRALEAYCGKRGIKLIGASKN